MTALLWSKHGPKSSLSFPSQESATQEIKPANATAVMAKAAKPRICMIVRSFAPRNESGSLRSTAFARHLPASSCELSVFCAAPQSDNVAAKTAAHYIDRNWVDPPEWQKVTRVDWDGAARRARVLHRLPLGASYVRRRSLSRIVNRLYPLLVEHLELCKPDVLYASAYPPETLLLARRAAKQFDIPFIADLRDPWSASKAGPYRHYIDYRLERALEKSVHTRASRVVVPTNKAAELLIEDNLAAREKVSVIPNGFLDEELDGQSPPAEIAPDKFLIVHAGEIYDVNRRRVNTKLRKMFGFDYDPMSGDLGTRSPVNFLQAVERLLDENPAMRDKIRIAFTGLPLENIPPSIKRFPYQDCLLLYGRLPTNEAHALMARADLFLLLVISFFQNGKERCLSIPAKTYSYLRLGRPILAPIISTEMQQLLQNFTNATVVAPDAVSDMCRTIKRLAEKHTVHQESNALPPCPDILKPYDRRAGARQLAGLIRELASTNEDT